MNTKKLPIIIVIFSILLLFVPEKALAATQAQPVILLPSKGREIGFVYEAFLNPNQEPAEEEDVPPFAPKEFLSTEPSVPRNQRQSRGHGMLRITKDLSKAYVDVKIENVNPEDINMFHIHCGRPDQLGPILIDFANSSNLQTSFADGIFEVELRNEDIEKVVDSGHGIVGAYTAGCPIVPGLLIGKVKTIAGMQYIAQKGELYFNLHTKAQTFYGDMRGKLNPVM